MVALRERKAAVAAAVSSKTAELTAAADRAREALTANLKVVVREDEGGGQFRLYSKLSEDTTDLATEMEREVVAF